MNPSRRYEKKILMLLVAAVALLSFSCLTTSRRNRGSLSNAMDKARDDHEGSREVPDNWRDDEPEWDTPYDDDSPEDYDRRERERQSSPETVSVMTGTWFSVRAGTSPVPSDDMITRMDFDLLVGLAFDKTELYFVGGSAFAYPIEGRSLDESVKAPLFFLKGGTEIRLKVFGDLSVTPWISAGIGAYIMFWEFQNPLTSGSDTISSDYLEGIYLSAGLGVYPVKTESIRLGVSVTPEIYLFGEVTGEGFDNDFFDPFYTLRIACEISFSP